MVALDQRPPLFDAIAQAKRITRDQVEYSDVTAAKRLLVESLAPHCSSMLFDPNFAVPAAIDLLPARCGLIMTLEEHRVEETAGGRKSRAIANWSVEKIRAIGGDAVKVLAWYRPDADGDRIVLWGDSFAPPNTRELVMDELQYEAGPQIEHQAEPAGALLATLAALYDDKVRAVAALGGLAEFSSALENAFAYVPMDAIIPSVLQKGDIADIAAALAPRPLLFANAVNGRNVLLERAELDRAFERVAKAYAGAGRPQNLATHPEAEAKLVTEWVVTALAK